MTKIAKIYLLLGIFQALHSMEEMYSRLYEFFWVATGFFHGFIPFLPQFRMSPDLFALLNMGIILIILASVPFLNAGHLWARSLAWLFAILEIINGLAHIGGVIIFSRYVPGAVTAPFLFLLGLVLARRLLKDKPKKAKIFF
jgi:hypothetical protein